jgi:hypothetical protein
LFSSLVLAASACNDDPNDEPEKSATARPLIQQVPPPLDLREPPKDATKTASGLIYRKLAARDTGDVAKPSDTVMVRYTGWRQSTGKTFFTMNGGEALGIDVAYAAPSFAEALQQLRKGEKAVLWVPPGQGTMETLVYEVEVVDIKSPTAVASRASDKSKAGPPGPGGTQAQATASVLARVKTSWQQTHSAASVQQSTSSDEAATPQQRAR